MQVRPLAASGTLGILKNFHTLNLITLNYVACITGKYSAVAVGPTLTDKWCAPALYIYKLFSVPSVMIKLLKL